METYYGVVRSPADAIKLFEACRLGLLPRVQRRLSEKERQAIRSGSVFVWDEREAGMRRWTDGKSWSASRVAGSFLTYREMEGKRGNGFGGGRRAAGKTPDSGRGSDEDHDDGEPDGYRYKPDGLTKQSFSITNSAGQHLHLIAYYSRGPHDLPLPSNDPALRHIVPAKGMYPESSLAEATPPAARAPLPPPPYLAPHHQPPPHHGYPQYPHPGYAWPPSPVGTPPYSHGHYAYAQGHPPPPPPPGPHPYPPHQHSSHHHPHPHPHPHQQPHQPYPPAEPNSAHERAPLPPPHSQYSQPQPRRSPHQQPHQPPHQQQPQLPAPLPPRMGIPAAQPYPQSQHHPSQGPPPRLSPLESPRSQHLQARAREAVQIEPPRLAPIDAARNQHSPLPAPGQLAHQQNGTAAPTTTPLLPPSNVAKSPTVRAPSPSPPRSAVSDGRTDSLSLATPTAASTRPTLSALLHPSAMAAAALGAGSEPSSANPLSANPVSAGGANSSAGSSPRTNGLSARQDARPQGEDARAIGVLNRNFF